MTGKEIIKILEQHGWQVLRVVGSHHRMGKGSFKNHSTNTWQARYWEGTISSNRKANGSKVKMKVLYPAVFEYDRVEKRYTVHFYDLPEAITEAETLEEAFFNASEVLTLSLEGRIDEGVDIPTPSQHKGAKLIAPSARAQAALLMRWAKGDHTTAEIARALNTSWPAVARLEDPHHWPNLRQLERAAAAVGQQLVISLVPVAKH